MDENELWETFSKTGRVEDYLRYRGVDIYAVQNALQTGDETRDTQRQTDRKDPHRRSDHPRI